MNGNFIRALGAALAHPLAMELAREVDACHAHARILGLSKEFRNNWAYEVRRNRSQPGPRLSPRECLQITEETAT